MKRLKNLVFFIFICLIIFRCSSPMEDEPVPENGELTLTSISPESKVAHMPSFTFTVKGSNFVSGSNIVFNGTEKQTVYVSSTELACQVDPDDTVLGSSAVHESMLFEIQQSEAVPVLVRNPSPGGGDSNSIEFTIRDNHSFDLPENLSNNLGISGLPAIAVDSSENINVAWCDDTPGNFEICFIRSTDDGTSWSKSVNISNNSGFSGYPAIAVDDAENINVVWCDYTPGNLEIYFSRSTNGGVTWSQGVNISNNSGTSDEPTHPAIAVDDAENINVFWWDDTPGNNDIYFVRSTDDGASWSKSVNISNNSGFSGAPAIAVDDAGNINVVWCDDTPGNIEIYFSRSTNDGVTWSQGVNISNNFRESICPDIAVDSSGNIDVVWFDNTPGNFEIYFSRSTDNGVSWSQTVNISDSWKGSEFVRIAVDVAGNINVVWCEYTPQGGGQEIYFSRSTDDGVSWSQAVNISEFSGGEDSPPCIAVDPAGNINLLWCDCSTQGDEDIYFTRSTR
ncbi:MAG: exo-alpha-sialidase [Candidatus Aminicenantes bacterium]|nr:exo-alpha-sialidase [Candidatus Aminicenantes bacterium]